MASTLALPDTVREVVRGRTDRVELAWLEQARAPRSGDRARAAIEAVLSLPEAEGALDRNDFEQALEILQPHEKALGSVPRAQEMLSRARRMGAEEQARQALRSLEAAQAVAATGNLEAARDLLQQLDRQALPMDRRAEAQALAERVRAGRTLEERTARIDALLAAGELLEARDELASFLDQGDEAHTRWQAQHAAVIAEIQRHWHLRVVAVDQAFGYHDWSDLAGQLDARAEVPVWLTPDGEDLLLCTAHDRWIFVRVIDLPRRKVRQLVVLCAPEDLGQRITAVVDGDSLWIFGQTGGGVELSRARWEVLRWRPWRTLGLPLQTIDGVALLPDSGSLWIEESRRIRQVRLGPWRIQRELDHGGVLHPVLGGAEPLVGMLDRSQSASLYGARGTGVRLKTDTYSAVAAHPGGNGVVFLTRGPKRAEGEGPRPLAMRHVVPGGRTAEDCVIKDVGTSLTHSLATARDDARTFLLANASKGDGQLMAFALVGDSIEEESRVIAPANTLLAQDGAGRRVVALCETDRGFEVQRLGSAPLRLRGPKEPADRRMPIVEAPFPCESLPKGRIPTQKAILIPWQKDITISKLLAAANRHRDANAGSPEFLYDLLLALARISRGDRKHAAHIRAARRELEGFALQRHPRHAELSLLRAAREATEGQWEEVRRLLDPVDPAPLAAASAAHVHHLSGLAHLHLGDAEEARWTWERGMKRPDHFRCGLDVCIALATPMSRRLKPRHWDPSQPTPHQLGGLVRATDELLDKQDAQGALRVAHQPAPFRARELQSLARLAEAHLRLEPTEGGAWCRKMTALACYCSVFAAPSRPLTLAHVVPDAIWDDGRLHELASRCRAWLERQSRTPSA